MKTRRQYLLDRLERFCRAFGDEPNRELLERLADRIEKAGIEIKFEGNVFEEEDLPEATLQ